MPHYEIDAGLPALVTTAETLLMVIPSIYPANVVAGEPFENNPVPTEITANVNVTPGTAATSIQFRIRQGTVSGALTGAVVTGVEQDNVTAAIPVDTEITGYDPAPTVFGWFLTAQQVAATANGTPNFVSADANEQ